MEKNTNVLTVLIGGRQGGGKTTAQRIIIEALTAAGIVADVSTSSGDDTERTGARG
jgi:Mg-chelatase subunit ChlI